MAEPIFLYASGKLVSPLDIFCCFYKLRDKPK